MGENNSVGAGGDQYVGLDQFGRVANQNWVNTATGTSVDNYIYTYDQNGNVTAKNNVLNSAYSETYTYDLLNRLTAVTRGGAAYQSWNLDSPRQLEFIHHQRRYPNQNCQCAESDHQHQWYNRHARV